MGCLQSTMKWKPQQESLATAINTLGYKRKPFKSLVKVFHHSFPYIYLSKSDLIDVLLSLRLTYSEEFYNNFKLSNEEFVSLVKHPNNIKYHNHTNQLSGTYSVKKLSTLAILLGKGDIETKARCLFLIYNIDDAMVLHEWEVNMMISNILEISLYFLPKMSEIVFHQDDSSMKKFTKMIAQAKSGLFLYFTELIILQSYEVFGIDKFIKKFDDPDINILLRYSDFLDFVIQELEQKQDLLSPSKEINETSEFTKLPSSEASEEQISLHSI